MLFSAKNIRAGNKIENLTREYFAELDNSTIDALYKQYKVDFEMFNYNKDL